MLTKNIKVFFHKKFTIVHIVSCLVDGIYSLADICNKIIEVDTPFKKIYYAKCGDNKQDVVFSCTAHMSIVIISVKMYDGEKFSDSTGGIDWCDETKTYCSKCVKKYLQKMYCYYVHKNFDLPLAIGSFYFSSF